MKRITLALACALGLTALSQPSLAKDISGVEAIDKDFGMYTLNWKPRGMTLIRWEIYNSNGFLVVCGGFSSSGGSIPFRLSKKALHAGRISMDDKVIVKDLSFFSILKNSNQKNEHVGEPANCYITDTPTPGKNEKPKFDIYIAQDTFRY